MKKIFLFLMLVFVSSFSFVQAEEAEVVECFDYYKFQSVQVNFLPDKPEYQPGEKITFQGELLNQNNYPVVDGYVLARISKFNPDYIREGHFIVDELIAVEKVALLSQEKTPVEFSWTIPQGSSAGDYRVDFFFSVGKKFNLGGLPFTNEIIVGLAKFQVTGENSNYLSFDKKASKVNGETYRHIGNWPRIKNGQAAEVSQTIKNTYPESKKVKVTYDLYWWDALNEKDKISSFSEEVEVPAKGEKEVRYTVPEMTDSVYFLKIIADGGDQKSIITARLAGNFPHARLNYPALTGFPWKKGEAVSAFSCFHGTSASNVKGKVILEIWNKNNKKVGEWEYAGDISGAMMAAKKDFIPEDNYSWLKLTAKVVDEKGEIDDQYETIYDCAVLGGEDCREVEKILVTPKEQMKDSLEKLLQNKMLWSFILLLLALVFAFILWLWKKKRKVNGASLLFIFFLLSGFITFSSPTEAYNEKSCTPGATRYVLNGVDLPEDRKLTSDGSVSVTHVVGTVSTSLNNFYVGDPIGFEYDPMEPVFFSTGYLYDTPFGAWCSDLSSSCGGEWSFLSAFSYADGSLDYDFENGEDCTIECLGGEDACLPLFEEEGIQTKTGARTENNVTAIKPAVSMVSDNPAIIECPGGMNCVAKGVGKTKVRAVVNSTLGKSWYQAIRAECQCYKPANQDASTAYLRNCTYGTPNPLIDYGLNLNGCPADSTPLVWEVEVKPRLTGTELINIQLKDKDTGELIKKNVTVNRGYGTARINGSVNIDNPSLPILIGIINFAGGSIYTAQYQSGVVSRANNFVVDANTYKYFAVLGLIPDLTADGYTFDSIASSSSTGIVISSRYPMICYLAEGGTCDFTVYYTKTTDSNCTLDLDIVGVGNVDISSNQGNRRCSSPSSSASCTYDFPLGTSLYLNAYPQLQFEKWSGDYTGTDNTNPNIDFTCANPSSNLTATFKDTCTNYYCASPCSEDYCGDGLRGTCLCNGVAVPTDNCNAEESNPTDCIFDCPCEKKVFWREVAP